MNLSKKLEICCAISEPQISRTLQGTPVCNHISSPAIGLYKRKKLVSPITTINNSP